MRCASFSIAFAPAFARAFGSTTCAGWTLRCRQITVAAIWSCPSQEGNLNPLEELLVEHGATRHAFDVACQCSIFAYQQFVPGLVGSTPWRTVGRKVVEVGLEDGGRCHGEEEVNGAVSSRIQNTRRKRREDAVAVAMSRQNPAQWPGCDVDTRPPRESSKRLCDLNQNS